MALFTAIGTALGATAATAFATGLGATALGVGAGVAAAGASGAFEKKKSPSVSMPQAPKIEDATAKAQATSLKRRQAVGRNESIQTSPLGISGEAALVKKQLLGQ